MSDRLIDDYLKDLRVSAWIRQVPKPRVTALEQQTRERIDAALADAGNRDDATVYGVLDRMGPAGEIVAREEAPAPTGSQRVLNTLLLPLTRLRFTLAARGWGAAEIGTLVLLMVGPFFLWWVGPVFGIILMRSRADRWSDRAEHFATVLVFGLIALHTVVALALMASAMFVPGPLGDDLQRLLKMLAPTALLREGFDPLVYPTGPMFVLAVVVGALPMIGGIVSGVYLWLSPRVRR
jgi:hypothetical protein